MSNWQKQLDEPLFEDILWSRPQRKSQAGKLLIVGGNKFEFARVQESHKLALSAGIGEIKVILPKPLQKLIGLQEDIFYLPATEGGSFSDEGYSELLGFADWADGVLIAGEVSRNSETVLMLRRFAMSWSGKLGLTHDALDQLANDRVFAERDSTLLVGGLGQFQRLASTYGSDAAIKFSDNLDQLVASISSATTLTNHAWITAHDSWISACFQEQTISTKTGSPPENWRTPVATASMVHWIQNPTKQLPAAATAIFEFAHPQASGKTAA